MSSSRATWLALALVALTALALHREVIFGGAVYHMDDAADGYYPCHVAIARAYAHGELPAWDADAANGWPMVADPYYGPFYPLGVIFGVFGAARGLGVQILLHTILCAAGMLLLLRRRGASPFAAAFGAASLALSSFLVCRIRHIIFPEGLAWFAFALAFVEGYLATRRLTELVLLSFAVGLTLLCGALPLLPFFAIFALLYAAPRIAGAPQPLRATVSLVVAALLGFALAAAQLVPTLSHLKLSPRALGTSYEFASSYAWPSLSYLATLVVPDLFGVEDRARWFGAFNHWEMAAYYTGVWALVLSACAFLRKSKLETCLLWIAALTGVALAFGDAGPLHGWFYRHLPLYAALRCPTRALVMSMFAWCVLGADGLDALVARVGPQRRGWLFAGGVMFALGLALAVTLVKTHVFYSAKGAMSGALVEGRLAFAHLAWVLGAGAMILALWASGRARRAVAPAFFALALGELYTLDRGYLQPKPADYVEGSQRFQAVDWLLAQKPTDRFALDPHGPFRLHNLGMSYAIPGATAYSSVQIFRFVNFLEVLATGRGLPTPLRSDPAASDVRRFDTPLVDLLNVRWVISDHLPAPGWIQRFHPVPGQGEGMKTPASKYEPVWDLRLGVWENPHVLPRAFVVHAAQVIADEKAEQAALAKLDPRKTALLEVAPNVGLPARSDLPVDPARVTESRRDRLRMVSDTSAPGILVVSDAEYPGWQARVDGQPAPLLRADYALRGVALSAGHHEVELRYRPRALWAALAVSLASAFALLVIALLSRTREARRRVLR